jgi:hypothetical protein
MRTPSILIGGAIAVAAIAAAPASAATQIGDGTLSIAGLFAPTVATGATTSTYSVTSGLSYLVAGNGSFAGLTGPTGTIDGLVTFSNTVGTTLAASLADFLTFGDGSSGTYNFSATSVKTLSYAVTPGVSSAISFYLLGTTVNSNLGLDATPTSLTLSFNSTGNSPYSTSATLSVPPSITGSVPETATWGMMLMGFGAMGAAMRRRRVNVTYA